MFKTICKSLLLMILFGMATVAQAHHYDRGYYQYGGYYNGYYSHRSYNHNDFVRGAVVGGVVTALMYEANRPRTVYVQPSTVIYRQEYDPYCRCYYTIRQYETQYYNYP